MSVTFTHRLISWYILSMSLLVISAGASYLSIQNLLTNAGKVTHRNLVIRQLELVISDLKDAETGQRGFLLTGNDIFLQPYTGSSGKALELVALIKKNTAQHSGQQTGADELRLLIRRQTGMMQVLIDHKRAGILPSTADLLQGKASMDAARRIIDTMEATEQLLLNPGAEEYHRVSAFAPFLFLLASALSLIITSSSFWQINKDLRKRIVLQLALEAKDLGIRNRILLIDHIAGQVSAGNYGIRAIEDEIPEDTGLNNLALHLNKMATALEVSFNSLHTNRWLQTGLNELNDRMIGEKEVERLCGDIITSLSLYTGSLVGALYLLGEDSLLQLQNSYALKRTRHNTSFNLGEGLPGQAAAMGKEILTRQIGQQHLSVSFAIGEVFPESVLNVPIFYERKLIGVMELGSLTVYSDRELQFLKLSAENIGIAIFGSLNRKKIQELLEETQSQSEELQEQHTELESLNSELQLNASRIQASEEELRVQQEELLGINIELEQRSELLEEQNLLIIERNLEIQKKAAELEQTSRYKSEFMANMSHELRTPLNSILLLSRLLADNHESNLSPGQVESARVIQNSGNGLLGLIDEILDLSKIEAGKIELEYNFTLFSALKENLESLFRPVAAEKQLELDFILDPELPAGLETDKFRLEQILRNLVSNALKFTPAGSVTLTIAPAVQAGYINFSVRDTGIGIAAEKHALIFQAFQQADGSTSRRFGGTGLGLSISLELCNLLQGMISFNSQPGTGSEFIVTLPLTLPAAMPLQTPEKVCNLPEPLVFSQAVRGAVFMQNALLAPEIPAEIEDDRLICTETDKLVLIVEDDTIFARVLLRFTRERGYKGIVAVRGDKALAMAIKYQPDAILLDLILPVTDGWQVLEKLKSHARTKSIPVHIMSSLEVKKESLQKGAVDFIHKPLALDDVRSVFSRLEKVISTAGQKVLIVEENLRHARALAWFLETFQVNSGITSELAESITLLLENKTDCVILDTGTSGLEVYDSIKTIKEWPELDQVPVIVFTGKSLTRTEESNLRTYADSVVIKTVFSYQRILDEVTLFLHKVEAEKPDSASSNVSIKGGIAAEVLKNKNVLITDDDALNIFSIGKTLEILGMNIFSAVDGKEAIELLELNPQIDVVLMDMMMPEMDGYESISRIRKIEKFSQLPVIAITARAMTGDREKCINAGASDYISKPVDTDQLISLLRVWLY